MSRLKETEGGREIRLLKQSQAIQEGQIGKMHEWRGIRLEGVRQEFIERRTSETEEERKIRLQHMKDANKKGVISETERMEIPNAKAERNESVSSSQ
jgi:hypothetical protein